MKQKNKQQKRAGKTDISPALSFILCAARRTTTQKQEAWSHSLLSFCLVHEMLHFLTYPLVFCHKMVCILFSAAFSSLPLKQNVRKPQAGFSACGGPHQRHNPTPPQCGPRRDFLIINCIYETLTAAPATAHL